MRNCGSRDVLKGLNVATRAKHSHLPLCIRLLFAIPIFLSQLCVLCFCFVDRMAPLQAPLTRFLFEGKVPEDGAASEPISPSAHRDVGEVCGEAIGTPIIEVVADSAGSNASKPQERAPSSQSDCVLLNALSTPIAPDVEIVDPVVASPLQDSGVGNMSAIGTSRTHGLPDCPGPNRYLGVMVALRK
jgi:hypothetical protein